MIKIFFLPLAFFVVGCSYPASGHDECDYVLWIGYKGDDIEAYLEGRRSVSIFEVLSRSINEKTEVWVEGSIATRGQVSYLIPMGSEAYARTSANRIELRFSDESNPLPDLLDTDLSSVYLIAGRLEREDKQWILSDTVYIRELAELPDACVSDSLD